MEDNMKRVEGQTSAPARPGYGLAVASFVLGICALACICCVWLAILLGVMAIVFGACGWKYGLGKAGTICGILAVGIYVVAFIKAGSEVTKSEENVSPKKEQAVEKATSSPQTTEAQKNASSDSHTRAEKAANKLISAVGNKLMTSAKESVAEAVSDAVTKAASDVATEAVKGMTETIKEVKSMESSLKEFESSMKELESILK